MSGNRRQRNFLSIPASLSHILLALLALCIGGYVLTQNVLFAFASFALIIALFFSDFSLKQGLRQNFLELAYAIGFAVAAWFLLGFGFHTRGSGKRTCRAGFDRRFGRRESAKGGLLFEFRSRALHRPGFGFQRERRL